MACEVFPRLWLGKWSKEDAPIRVTQLKPWTAQGVDLDDRARLACAASPDALDATAAAIGLARLGTLPNPPTDPRVEREGWIAGVAC